MGMIRLQDGSSVDPHTLVNKTIEQKTNEMIDEIASKIETAAESHPEYFTAKQDDGKPMFRLIPMHLLAGVAKVREYGVKKYKTEHSWKDVPDARNRYTDALFRHLFAWLRGEKNDPESGLPHIDHACCNLIFLMQFEDK